MTEDQFLTEQTHESSSQFAARVRMSARLPMTLTYEELKGMDEFFVITSHEGCNSDGEREPYR
jgi:hypothetical protein